MDRQHLLNQYATDMAGVTNHILNAVEHQRASDATDDYPELRPAPRPDHQHAEVAERCARSLQRQHQGGGALETAKEAFLGFLGEAAGLVDRLRQTDQVSRMVRDDYTALSLAAVSYHMLHTTALGLKDQPLADLALKHLGEITPILVDLSKTVCTVVASELNDEDRIIDPTVADEAIRNTQRMWSAEHVGQ